MLVSKSYAPTPSSIGEGYYYGRTWRHLDCFEYACYLHCDLPRFHDKQTGKSTTLDLNISCKGVNMTLKLEEKIMDLMQIHHCFKEVAQSLGLYPQR